MRHSRRIAVGAAVAVLAVILAVPSAATATVRGFNGKIVFSSYPDSCEYNCGRFVRLFTVNADGSGLAQLGTQLPMSEISDRYDEGPRFSPDGMSVGFTRSALDQSGSIVGAAAYTMRTDGSGQRVVRNGRRFIGWLPNGRMALEDPYTGAKSTVTADGD